MKTAFPPLYWGMCLFVMYDQLVQAAVRRAARSAGLAKHVCVHTVRHSFARHLLLNGAEESQSSSNQWL